MSKTLQANAIAVAVSVVFLAASLPMCAQGTSQPFGVNGGSSNSVPAAKTTQLDNLKAQYQQGEQALVKPIRDNYLLALNALMKTLTQNQRLDEALAVQQEMKNTEAAPAPSFVDQIAVGAQPAGGMPTQLDMLKSKYSSDLRTAIRPIQERYLVLLNNMLNAATQSANLDLAVAIRDEMKNAAISQPAAPPSALSAGAPGGATGAVGAAAGGPGQGWFYVQAQVSGLYLHVYAGSRDVGGKIDQAKKSSDQVWKFIPDGKGNYYIQSKMSELFLDAKPSIDGMDQVRQSADAAWQLTPDGSGNYYIKSVATGNNLDVHFANKDVGGMIHLAPQDGKQTWKLIPYNGGL